MTFFLWKKFSLHLQELADPLLSTQWGRRLAWVMVVVFSVLLMYVLTIIANNLRQDFNLLNEKKDATQLMQVSNETAKWIHQIPEEHLFGQSEMMTPKVLPVTSLQLRLMGVVKEEPESFSRVIISEGGKPGKVYQIGDTLPSGVRVNSIGTDGVVLENGGRLEKLPLVRTPLEFKGMPTSILRNTE